MVNEELVEGIRRSLAKGESLQQAMASFYNAGYERGEIESAARAVQMEQFQSQYNNNQMQQNSQPSQQNQNTQNQPQQNTQQQNNNQNQQNPISQQQLIQKLSAYGNKQNNTWQQPYQKPQKNQVSNYEDFPKKKLGAGKLILIIFLVIFLLALIGGLISAFIFREDIINYFNGL